MFAYAVTLKNILCALYSLIFANVNGLYEYLHTGTAKCFGYIEYTLSYLLKGKVKVVLVNKFLSLC